MRVLVTGGAGYVGSVLVPMLLHEGYEVRVLDNLMYGGRGLLGCFGHKGFELVVGDVREYWDVQNSLDGVDFVLHLAAIVGYPACKKNEELARTTNLDAVKLIRLVCEKKAARLIFASSGSVYGIIEGGMCTEDSPLNPVSVYSETKVGAEEAVLRGGYGTCLRFATGFGASPRMRLDLVLHDFCYQALKAHYLVVYEKSHRRTFIHVADMARSYLFAMKHFSDMRGDVYNVGDESLNVDKEHLANYIRTRVEYYLHFAEIGTDGDARNYEVSYDKIHDVGFKTEVSLNDGIDEVLASMSVIDVSHEFANV